MKPTVVLKLAGLACMFAGTVHAAGLQVGTGSSIYFGDAAIDLGCNDLVVEGSASAGTASLAGIDNVSIPAGGALDGSNGRIVVTGDFEHAGSFNAGTGTVAIVDGCGNTQSHIAGDTTFNHLEVTTATAKQLTLDANKTSTINGKITLQGTAGNLLKIRSSVPGSVAQISATSLQEIDFVDVSDNRATGQVIAYGQPKAFHSVAGSNIFSWFYFDGTGKWDDPLTKQIPTLSTVPLFALALILAWLASRRLTRRGR